MEDLECSEASGVEHARKYYSVTHTHTRSSSSSVVCPTLVALVVAIVGVCLATSALVKVESVQHDVNTAAAQALAASDNSALLLQREVAHISTILASSPYCSHNASTWKSCMNTLATAENLVNNLHSSSEYDLVSAVSKGTYIVGHTEVIVSDAEGDNVASYNSAAVVGEQSTAAKIYHSAQSIGKIHFQWQEKPIIIVGTLFAPSRRERRCLCETLAAVMVSCCSSGADSLFEHNTVTLIPSEAALNASLPL